MKICTILAPEHSSLRGFIPAKVRSAWWYWHEFPASGNVVNRLDGRSCRLPLFSMPV
jgi:hypothetical protein